MLVKTVLIRYLLCQTNNQQQQGAKLYVLLLQIAKQFLSNGFWKYNRTAISGAVNGANAEQKIVF